MKILVVAPYLYPEGGGLERYAHETALELGRSHEVVVVCSTKGAGGEERIGAIKITRRKPLFMLSNTPIRPQLPFELLSLVKKRGINLVVAHTPVPFYVDAASIVAKLRRIPLIIYYHTGRLEKGLWIDFLAKLYSISLERLTLKNAKLIAVSHYVARILWEKGFRAAVEYPSMNKTLINIKPNYKGFYVLFVGQLTSAHRWKGLEALIEAFVRVREELPKVRLIVIGTGDLMNYYRLLVKRLGIEDAVIFRGYVTDEELIKLYTNAKLLVLPSSANEAFGKVVLEAMAAGTPVIVSNLGEFPAIVENGKSGLVVTPTPRKLSLAIIKLLKNEKHRRKLGVLARKRVECIMNVPKGWHLSE